MKAERSPVRSYFNRRLVIFIFVGVMLVMGMIYGILAANSLEDKSGLLEWVREFFNTIERNERAPVETVVRNALWDDVAKTTGLMWLLGLSIIGAPFVLGLAFLRSFVLGFTAGFMVKEMAFKGVVLVLVSLIPQHLFTIAAIFLAGGASMSFSVAAFKTLLGKSTGGVYNHFITTTFLCLVASGLLLLGALVEFYITPVFIELVRGYVL